MIHDIDLIEHIVRSPIASIDAIGAPVFTDEIDIANARIRFANGCVADVTASRISLKAERKLRVFQADAYLSIDLQQKLLSIVRKPATIEEGVLPKVDLEERSFEQGDALLDEIRSFVDAVAQRRAARSCRARTGCARSRPRRASRSSSTRAPRPAPALPRRRGGPVYCAPDETHQHGGSRLLPQGGGLPVGVSHAHGRARVHPADRPGPLLGRLHRQPRVERVPGHPRARLRPALRAGLPARPGRGKAGRDLPPEARRGGPAR